jgi:hypothetical protein
VVRLALADNEKAGTCPALVVMHQLKSGNGVFRLQGCQAWDAMSVEMLAIALILTQHTDDLVDESSTDVI